MLGIMQLSEFGIKQHMNPSKCDDQDYINFLVATPRVFSALEAARVQPPSIDPPAHDAFIRLLHRLEPDPTTLWHKASRLIRGCLSLMTRLWIISRRARSDWSRAIGRASITEL